MKTFFTTMRKTRLRYGWFLMFYVVASIVISAATVAMNRVTGEMGESAFDGSTDVLVRLLLLASGLIVIRAIFSAGLALWNAKFSAAAGYNLRQHFINHFLRVPFAKIDKAGSGESLSIYSTDLPDTEAFVVSHTVELISSFVMFLASFIFMMSISAAFTGVLILSAVVLLGIQLVIAIPLQKRGVEASEKAAAFNAVVNDSLQNLSVVAAYSLDEVLEDRYMKAYETYFDYTKRMIRYVVVTVVAAFALMLAPLVVVFTVLAFSAIAGNLSIAEFIAFSTTITIAAGGLMGTAQGVGTLMAASARAKRFNSYTSEALENLQDGEALELGSEVALSFKNVTFAYDKPNEDAEFKTVLDDVSFDIPAGSRVAFVGESGSGKSTVLKLLMGLFDPQNGQISIGSKDISTLTKSGIRNAFAYVPQDSFLFPQSIAQNITLTGKITDLPRLEKACADAGILDFIRSLPDGFDSILTEASENISGGQRQRIAMARAFYKNAPVILFDEATSSLDPATEAAILKNFAGATTDKTVIMVAHRESAIAVCDTVIMLDSGKIVGIQKKEALA